MNDTTVIDGLYGDVITVSRDGINLLLHTREEIGGNVDIFLSRSAATELYNAIGDRLGFGLRALQSSPKWEEITVDPKGAGHTYRLSVPGGWLYRTVSYDVSFDGEENAPIVAQSTTFVPTPPVREAI